MHQYGLKLPSQIADEIEAKWKNVDIPNTRPFGFKRLSCNKWNVRKEADSKINTQVAIV